MKTLLELEPNDCRYPMNDGGPYLFCAEPQHWRMRNGELVRSSYCRTHHFVCSRESEGVQA